MEKKGIASDTLVQQLTHSTAEQKIKLPINMQKFYQKLFAVSI